MLVVGFLLIFYVDRECARPERRSPGSLPTGSCVASSIPLTFFHWCIVSRNVSETASAGIIFSHHTCAPAPLTEDTLAHLDHKKAHNEHGEGKDVEGGHPHGSGSISTASNSEPLSKHHRACIA